jgi:meiotically up-regulated gene 157 (Mug157) protein
MNLNFRIPFEKRTFNSLEVDKYIENLEPKFNDKILYKIFSNCYPNTLDKTISYNPEKEETFIITGDINAMWLRDSSLQIYPYLKHCIKDKNLSIMIKGLFKKQISFIIFDSYANAFNKTPLKSPWVNDITYKRDNMGNFENAMNPNLWERKFELDSILFPLYSMSQYFLLTSDISVFNLPNFFNMLNTIISLIKKERRGTDEENENGGPEYSFQRSIAEPFDSLHFGRGNPCKTCGLIKTSFRNSDDSALFPYNIPENCLLVSTFKLLLECFNDDSINNELKEKFEPFKKDIKNTIESVEKAIYEKGVIIDPNNGEKYFAFEIDGYGNYYFMDEPRYPSLLSLPFFGFCDYKDEIYLNTRKRILSNKNPYYIVGKYGSGESSAHSFRNYNGTLFTIMRGLTSINQEEIKECLDLIIKSTNGLNYLHEYFDINNINCYVNLSFAYAYSFFCILVGKCLEEYPELLLNMK